MQKNMLAQTGLSTGCKSDLDSAKKALRKALPHTIDNGPSGGIERADPLVPEGRGVAQLHKKCSNKKGKKSHE